MVQVWARQAGQPVPSELLLPASTVRRSVALDEVHPVLDQAELLLDAHPPDPKGEAMLQGIDLDRLARRGADALDIQLVELRIDSIRRAAANHLGEGPTELNEARSVRLFASGKSEAADEVVHFHNRVAVAHLNHLDLDAALRIMERFRDWRDIRKEFSPFDLGDSPVIDWNRGALLGTEGQAWAFNAHATQDPAHLDRAVECFELAESCFTDPGDRARQQTYRLHALIERARLGARIEAELAELRDAIAQVGSLKEVPRDDVRCWKLAALLKAGWAAGLEIPWLGRLENALTWVSASEALAHPWELVVGGLLLLSRQRSGRLMHALRATAQQDASELGRWVAASYVAAIEESEAPEPPTALRPWYEKYDMAARASDPLAVVPFNYA